MKNYYDVKQKQYGRLRLPSKWTLRGLLSPDQAKSIEGGADNIWLYNLNGTRKLLGSGFWVNLDIRASTMSKPPLFWLDNNNILTQKANGKIVILRLDGTVAPIVDIPVKKPAVSLPYFYRDGEGNITYKCSGEAFAIDIKNRSYTPYKWSALGHQFTTETERNPLYGHIVRYRGQEIGKVWGDVWNALTNDEYIAVEYGEVGANLGYPKGIQVWSQASGKWTTIDVKGLTAIVGWIDE
ncbi:MAG: hypothetical protein HY231_18190 [Acidobacteria bacterium]|nr:hypothetical protein [Acidobacteriota bacterium]